MILGDRYAPFVWPAYGLSLLGFVWMIVDTFARARRWRRRAETLEKEADAADAPPDSPP